MLSQAFGGATSFDDVDRWVGTQQVQRDVDALGDVFQAISRNVWANPDMDVGQKAEAIARAARDLSRRLGGGPIPDADALDEEADEAEPEDMMQMRYAEDGKPEGPLSRVRSLFTKAAPTKTEGGVAYRASDYADVPDASKPTTWKLRLAEGRPGNFTVAQIARAITAMGPGGFRGNRVQSGTAKGAIASKISAAIDKAKGDDTQKANLRKRLASVKEADDQGVEWGEFPGGFRAFKDAKGDWRWAAIWSNRYQDRDGEVFSEAAHRDYEAYVDRTKDFPELLLWHTPGTRLGVADVVAYDDRGFMLAAGSFDSEKAAIATKLASEAGVGCSHGYYWERKDFRDGVYHRYRSREISALPVERAANPLTSFGSIEEELTMLNPAKKAWMEKLLGPDKVKELETSVGTLAAKAQADGLSFKELFADGGQSEPPTASATPPADAAAGSVSPPAPASGDPMQAMKEAFSQVLAPVTAELQSIKASVESQATEIAALKQSDDAKIAALITPRAQPGAKAASQSDATLVHGNSAIVQQAKKDQAGAPSHLAYYEEILSGQRQSSEVVVQTPASVA